MKQGGRISELQRRIVLAIAKHISNDNSGDDPSLVFVRYGELYHLVYPAKAVDGKEYRSRRAAMSRSIRDLIEKKHLVSGLALAWILKDGEHEDLLWWQGGARKRTDLPGYSFKDDTPTYRMFALTEKGVKLAERISGNPAHRRRENRRAQSQPPRLETRALLINQTDTEN